MNMTADEVIMADLPVARPTRKTDLKKIKEHGRSARGGIRTMLGEVITSEELDDEREHVLKRFSPHRPWTVRLVKWIIGIIK